MAKRKIPTYKLPKRELKGMYLGSMIVLDRSLEGTYKKSELNDLGPEYVAVLVSTMHDLEEAIRELGVKKFGLNSSEKRSH